MALQVDVSDPQSVKDCLQAVYDRYKRAPDHIVNSAGVGQYIVSILETENSEVDRVMAINYKGTFYVNKYGGQWMIRCGVKNGSIVNIGSNLGLRRVPCCSGL